LPPFFRGPVGFFKGMGEAGSTKYPKRSPSLKTKACGGAPESEHLPIVRLAFLMGLALACEAKRAGWGEPPARPSESAARAARPVAPRADAVRAEQDRRCRERVERLRAQAPRFDPILSPEARGRLLAEVKATPVLFLEEPRFDTEDQVAQGLRRQLERSEVPGRPLARLLSNHRRFHKFFRSVVLTEGYLHATTPALGMALAEGLSPEDLFHDPEIVIERGAERLAARRDDSGRYDYFDGPERGERARVLLWDRIYVVGEELPPPKHVDVRTLAAELGFDRFEVERVAGKGVLAALSYGDLSVPTVLERKGARLALSCELGPGERRPVDAARARSKRRKRVLDSLTSVIGEQVAEALPFDEPKTEFGQEDGKLRQEWRQAYTNGRTRYEFNGDR
jgi:hypothetical protein